MNQRYADLRAIAAGITPLSIAITSAPAPHALLRPVTSALLDDPTLVQALTRWRTESARWFHTQFTPTPERTRAWLAERVVADPRRLLFLIEDAGAAVGTIGFINLGESEAELDNLIRGERRGAASLMFEAEVALLRWMFEFLSLRTVTAAVLGGNFAALQLHQAVGFSVDREVAMKRVTVGDTIMLVEAGSAADYDVLNIHLSITRETFDEENPA